MKNNGIYVSALFISKYTFILLFCYVIVLLLVWNSWIPAQKHRMGVRIKNREYFINTSGCIIPFTDAFDASIKWFIMEDERVQCPRTPDFTYQLNHKIFINREILSKMADFSHCSYQVLTREEFSDDEVTYSEWTHFTSEVEIHNNFIHVRCFQTNGKEFYRNYHAFVFPNHTLLHDLNSKILQHKSRVQETFSVLMIGIDSLSRLNHIRTMPKTRKMLLETMSAIDLHGYNKVSDNTYKNFVPMTTGNYVNEELLRSNTTTKGPFDRFNIIWKNYSVSGYSTMTAEDDPYISALNYIRHGFARQPTEHYYRPMALAMEDDEAVWTSDHFCVQNRSETGLLLKYTYDFIKEYKDRPTFTFTFITRLTHDNLNYAASADEEYYNMLETSYKQGLLDNTILFFFSDHGFRFGSFVDTDIGKIENRMPMMYVVLPEQFRKTYPDIVNNVKKNSNRLTSTFDIYETLKDILYFTGRPKGNISVKQRGISLFEEIPEERTCIDAEINFYWCACKEDFIQLTMDNDIAKQTVHYVIQQIKKQTQNLNQCAIYKLKKVKSVKLFKQLSGKMLLRINVVLSPGDAEFDTIVNYQSRTNLTLFSDIIRVSRYGHTADCIDDANLRGFCYCS